MTLGGAQHLNPAHWRAFVAEFNLRLQRLQKATGGKVTEREVEERIRDELPEDLRRTLDNEMVRRSQGHWVRLPEPLPMPVEVIEEVVTQLTQQPLAKAERVQGGGSSSTAGQEKDKRQSEP